MCCGKMQEPSEEDHVVLWPSFGAGAVMSEDAGALGWFSGWGETMIGTGRRGMGGLGMGRNEVLRG